MKKILPLFGGIGIACVVLLLPISGLSFQGKAALAILFLSVVWWIFKVLPDYMTAMLMGILFMLLSDVPMTTACSAFSGSTWWLLFSAFGLSLGVSKCGILKRISHKMLELFPNTFLGQVIGLLTVGFVSAPFIPSMSAKAAILAPLSLGISDSMGFTRKSKPASGLFLAMLTGLRSPGPLFISASVIGYALQAQYSAEINEHFTTVTWFLAVLPWFLTTTAATLLFIWMMYRPSNRELTTAQQTNAHPQEFPPMSRDEKIMAVLLTATLLLWVTEPLHGQPAHNIALASLFLMLVSKVISPAEFRANMYWENMIFIGFIMGIAPTFTAVGIDTWIVSVFMPVFSYFSSNTLLFILCVAVITILLRFIIVSEIAYINIVFVFLTPLAERFGINPWVVGITIYAVVSPWFFLYQNPVYMTACQGTNAGMIEHKTAASFCIIYLLICIASLVLSVPYWKGIGALYL